MILKGVVEPIFNKEDSDLVVEVWLVSLSIVIWVFWVRVKMKNLNFNLHPSRAEVLQLKRAKTQDYHMLQTRVKKVMKASQFRHLDSPNRNRLVVLVLNQLQTI